ncbi:hypothetical protein PCANC_26094, partial [Puccinia coronata f. sp. avenae]
RLIGANLIFRLCGTRQGLKLDQSVTQTLRNHHLDASFWESVHGVCDCGAIPVLKPQLSSLLHSISVGAPADDHHHQAQPAPDDRYQESRG